MNRNISAQDAANTKGLVWASTYLKNGELDDVRDRLIKNKVILNRIKYAASVNPAVAVFGESQVGKSYMVDCLLTSFTSTLHVYDAKGKATGFLESINPTGNGREATALITRFTINKVWENEEFPIRCKMLSITDVISVIVDSYFNDVRNVELPKREEVIAFINKLKEKYANGSKKQDVITENEIYELREYFNLGIMERGESFRESLIEFRFFEQLSELIPNIDIKEWVDVFGFLWNHNEIISATFNKLINILCKLDFCDTVYIKTDAVIREFGTIMHVDRLFELFNLEETEDDKGNRIMIERASVPIMEVYTESGKIVTGVLKSEFCAIAMEVDLTVVDPTGIEPSIQKEKKFLEKLDILDFPGARSRLVIAGNNLTNKEVCNMILRGKVAYLFNKYSQQYLISNLLFCHHDAQSNVNTLSSLLLGWIENTIGRTPEERQLFIDKAKISPLFIVGTKFNIDLTIAPDDTKGSVSEILNKRRQKWTKRFGNLQNVINTSDNKNWFSNWTTGDKNFRNIYLLRSFEYSTQIFEGYITKSTDENGNVRHIINRDETGKIVGETDIKEDYKKFLTDLEATFKEDDFVKNHFYDSKISWEEVAVPRKDGSEYILRKLTESGEHMVAARDMQFDRLLNDTFKDLCDVLYKYYHDDASDLEFRRQMKDAGAVQLGFDGRFITDKYLFTDFLSSILIKENDLYNIVLDVINDIQTVVKIDLSQLFAIRYRAGIDPEVSYEENVERLLRAYVIDEEEELESILNEMGFSIKDVIYFPAEVKNFERSIVEAISSFWFDNYLVIEHFEEFINRGLRESILDSFLKNFRVLYNDTIKMDDVIAKRLHPLMKSDHNLDTLTDMISDISAEMINKFVNTVGAAYYSEQKWADLTNAVVVNGFDINVMPMNFNEIDIDEYETRDKLNYIFEVFDNADKILNEYPVDKEAISRFSYYDFYRRWTELMKVSFLATYGIPKYDKDMNDALRKIIYNEIVCKDELKSLVANNEKLSSLRYLQNV